MAKTIKEIVEEPLEKKLWKAADKLRKNMDAAEYKHVALGLIFLKYISDAFEELFNKLKEGKADYELKVSNAKGIKAVVQLPAGVKPVVSALKTPPPPAKKPSA